MVNLRLLAVIPARGGSKRLPRKNARLLGGKPLIAWSIDAALATHAFCDVLLTTDDHELAKIGREAGALVPWLRPSELANDTANSNDVLKHALNWYETERNPVDGVVLLQPTSPFRRTASLIGAVQFFIHQPGGGDRHTVVSVSPLSVPAEWCFRIDVTSGALRPILNWPHLGKRSQDLQPIVHLNGSIYIADSTTIRAGRPLVEPSSLAFLMPGPEEGIDIDTEEDWQLAELFLSR